MKLVRLKVILRKSKWAYILLLLSFIICIWSAFIAINVTINAKDNYSKFFKPVSNTSESQSSSKKELDLSKLKPIRFIFGGTENEEVKAYSYEENKLFIPLEYVLKNDGYKMEVFPTDGIYRFINKDKTEIKLTLGDNRILAGNNEISVEFAPVTYDNHIYVQADLIKYLGDMDFYYYKDKQTLYIYKNSKDMDYGLKVLRMNNGYLRLDDFFSSKTLWKATRKSSQDYTFRFPQDKSKALLLSNGTTYLFDKSYGIKPFAFNQNGSTAFSSDGRYLYWFNTSKSRTYVYDLINRRSSLLGDYILNSSITDNSGNIIGSSVPLLYDYYIGSGIKRAIFKNEVLGDMYCIITKDGNTVLDANVQISPNKTKLLYHEGKKYYVCNLDGTGKSFLQFADNAQWVNDNSVFLTEGETQILFTFSGELKSQTVYSEYRYLGKAQNSVFYTDSNSLFVQEGNLSRKLLDLNFKFDSVIASKVGDPMLVISQDKDSVYYMMQTMAKKIAKYSELATNDTVFEDGRHTSIEISPDKRYYVVLTLKDQFYQAIVIDTLNNSIKNFSFDRSVEDNSILSPFNIKWLNNSQFIMSTSKKSWICDVAKDFSVKSWEESSGTSLIWLEK